MKLNKFYFRQWWSENAYCSSHIEGNSLTLNTTCELINETIDEKTIISDEQENNVDLSFNQENKIKNDIREIVGFKQTSETMFLLMKKQYVPSPKERLQEIKEMHYYLMRPVFKNDSRSIYDQFKAGDFKQKENKISTSNGVTNTIAPSNVEKNLLKLFANYQEKMNSSKTLKDKIFALAYLHGGFEGIHPFIDGNGRVGRLYLSLESFRHGLPLIRFSNDHFERKKYYESLEKLNNKNLNSNVENFEEMMNIDNDSLSPLFKLISAKMLDEMFDFEEKTFQSPKNISLNKSLEIVSDFILQQIKENRKKTILNEDEAEQLYSSSTKFLEFEHIPNYDFDDLKQELINMVIKNKTTKIIMDDSDYEAITSSLNFDLEIE